MWNKYKSALLSYVFVKVIILVCVILLFFIPTLIKYYVELSGKEDYMYWLLMVITYLSALPIFVSLFSANKLLSNIKKDVVFDNSNVNQLRYISWCCFIVGFIFFVLGFFLIFSFFIFATALFFGLMIRVIKNVFAEAVVIKSENDYTI